MAPVPCSQCALREKPLFRKASDEELRFIAGVRRETVVLPQRTHIVWPDVAADNLYTLFQGWAYRYRSLEGGTRQILDFLLPGDLIGLAAAGRLASSHGVCALTDVRLCRLDGDLFRAIYREQAGLVEGLLRNMLLEEARADRRLLLLGRQRPSQRLCYLMLELRDRLAARGMGTAEACDFPLTYEQMTDGLGVSRSQLARSLAEIRERGWATLADGRLSFLAPGEMARFCGYDGRLTAEARTLI